MTETSQLTIDTVMQGYQRTKDQVEVLAKKHEAEMQPLTNTLEMCKAWMLNYLNVQGLENARSAHGLAYKSTIMSATVDPEGGWDLLLKYILEKGLTRVLDAIESGASEGDAVQQFLTEPSLSFFNRAVNKTAVQEAMEQGVTVPGVKIAHVVQLNVRKS